MAPELEGSSPHSRQPERPLSSARWVHSTPPPQLISLRSIMIPSSHLRLGLPTKILYNFLPSPTRATCPAHLIHLDLLCLMISDECKLWSSPLCNFLHCPVTSSPLGPNILLSTLFSNILSLCSSLNVTDRVTGCYSTLENQWRSSCNFLVLRRELTFPDDKKSAKQIVWAHLRAVAFEGGVVRSIGWWLLYSQQYGVRERLRYWQSSARRKIFNGSLFIPQRIC
jgi:hypothetical protein